MAPQVAGVAPTSAEEAGSRNRRQGYPARAPTTIGMSL